MQRSTGYGLSNNGRVIERSERGIYLNLVSIKKVGVYNSDDIPDIFPVGER